MCVADTLGCNNAPMKNETQIGHIYSSGVHTIVICTSGRGGGGGGRGGGSHALSR